MKEQTMTSIDSELKKKAKEKFLNISEITEKAIKEKLQKINVEIDHSIEKCEFCGRKEEKATAENLIGLCWLCPNEKWICSTCLKQKVSKIPVRQK